MEKNTYSKVYTQFETQAMAFGRLKVSLKGQKWFVRGYPEHIVVYQESDDSRNPTPVMKIVVRSSSSPDEVGFFKKSEQEWLLIGMDAAWKISDSVLPKLYARAATQSASVPSPV